ncbi:MAG TPA: FkbM family methyltransferase [Hyphomicrobium sp.]
MDRNINRGLERLFLDEICIGKATQRSDIIALIEALKPTAEAAELRRFGPAGDGGYLMPDDLDGVVACISPGVSLECGFDEEIASRGIDVVMADASVEGPSSDNPRFHFLRKYLDITTTDQTVTMQELCHDVPEACGTGDLILQMDIEGAEYRVLAGMSDELLQRFRIMVIEFHYLDQIFQRFSFDNIIKPVFERLLAYHDVVHIHPNNCLSPVRRASVHVPPIMEFTFHRKDRRRTCSNRRPTFPHPLDAGNVPTRSTLILPDCWWQ